MKEPERPVEQMHLDEVEDEYEQTHALVERLLTRISALSARREALRREEVDGLHGAGLADVALVDDRAAEHLREQTRSMHPLLVGVQRYAVDLDGNTLAWAPAVEVSGGEVEGLPDAIHRWFATFGAPSPAEEDRVRHRGRVLVDARQHGEHRWQVWLAADGTALAVDHRSGRKGAIAHQGPLADVLEVLHRA